MTVTTNHILQFDGAVMILQTDTCSVLAAGKSGVIVATIRNNIAYACKMVISPSAADVRGAFELRSGLNVLQNVELR